jgi:hypothetical protein
MAGSSELDMLAGMLSFILHLAANLRRLQHHCARTSPHKHCAIGPWLTMTNMKMTTMTMMTTTTMMMTMNRTTTLLVLDLCPLPLRDSRFSLSLFLSFDQKE